MAWPPALRPLLTSRHGSCREAAPSRRYQLPAEGYSLCLIFLKLFDRVYAPLTAGVLQPVSGAGALPPQKRCLLDRLYRRLADDLDHLLRAIGLALSPPVNE